MQLNFREETGSLIVFSGECKGLFQPMALSPQFLIFGKTTYKTMKRT